MIAGKCTDVFRGIFFWFRGEGRGGGGTWEDIPMGEENFNEGGAGFSSII